MISDRASGARPRLSIAAASAVMLLGIWLSSGTMAPYAATLDSPLVLEPCHHLANIDHEQFEATFAFLDGAPPEEWSYSLVLRRLLFPLLAYPLMKAFGFLWGGILTSMLLHLLAMALLDRFVRRRYSEAAAVVAAWLLATYPGVAYWGGLPYSYAIIVPACIVAVIALFRIDESGEPSSLVRSSLLLGLTFTAYDLLPFFGAASVLLVLRKRSVRASIINAASFLLPPGAVAAFLLWHPAIPDSNPNTGIYATIVRAYLEPVFTGWGSLLSELPKAAWGSFIFGNFVVLPLAWLLALPVTRVKRRFERVELAVLLAVTAVFLVNNLAPVYYGWQMRGDWIARLYQPIFVVFLLSLARMSTLSRTARWISVAAVVLNAVIVFGPVTGNRAASFVYARFYRHGTDQGLTRNLERFGRRPLGVCAEDHRMHESPMAPFERRDYMYKERPGRPIGSGIFVRRASVERRTRVDKPLAAQ